MAYALTGTKVLAQQNGKVWRHQRKIISPPFRKQFDTEVFQLVADELAQHWESLFQGKDSALIEVNGWIQRLTMDVLGQTILGHSFNCLATENSELMILYKTSFSRVQSGLFFHIFPWFDRWWFPFRYNAWKDLWRLQELMRIPVQQKRKEFAVNREFVAKKDKSLMAAMIEASMDDEDPLTEEELLVSYLLMFFSKHIFRKISMAYDFFSFKTLDVNNHI